MRAYPLRQRLIGRSFYISLALLILFARLVPLHPGRITLPGPDLTLCLTLAWVLRRPRQVPAIIIAAVFLIDDAMLMRPIGLWAAIVVVGTELARSREAHWRELPFMVEWLRVCALILAMAVAERLATILFMLPPPPAGLVVLHLLATMAAYPPVVAATYLIGLRRRPRVVDEMAGS